MIFTLILLTVIGFSAISGYKGSFAENVLTVPFSTVQKFIYSSKQFVTDNILFMGDIKKLRKENELLNDENQKVKNDYAQLLPLKEENKKLQELLGLKNQYNNRSLSANIIAKDAGNWSSTYVIDVGQKDGVVNNSIVLSNNGLIGRVDSSNFTSSKVLSILDESSTVSVRTNNNKIQGLLKGSISLKDKGLCIMENIPANETDSIKIGDYIETTGIGGLFPKDILVGKVVKIIESTNTISISAVIEPVAELDRLGEVLLILP